MQIPNTVRNGMRLLRPGQKWRLIQRIARLQGKIIGITGTIELYRGKPEIKVLLADQIKGSDLGR
jgi:DNA/RNA endonuclease YhcR with UshA esterase domain